MSFQMPAYQAPDFTKERFVNAPSISMAPAPHDGVAPEYFHSTGIDPEYFKIDGKWVLADRIRMDCVPALRDCGRIDIVEFRHLKQGDIVLQGREEDCSEGIFVHSNPFATKESASLNFSFRKGRTRETGFSRDYKEIVELLKHEKENGGYCVWVTGPAFTFDVQAREAFSKIVKAGYVQAVLAGNALATHDLEGATLHTIATGNLTSSFHVQEDGTLRPVYFYSVDTSDFSANKLADCGSLSAKGIVANAQDFITKVAAALGL